MAQRHIRFIGRHWYGITYHDSNRIPKSDKTLWSTQKSILIGYIRQLQEKIDSIVHCKDCKYWAECTFAQPTKDYCGRLIQADYNNHNFGFEMDADDFCSKGEKK